MSVSSVAKFISPIKSQTEFFTLLNRPYRKSKLHTAVEKTDDGREHYWNGMDVLAQSRIVHNMNVIRLERKRYGGFPTADGC